MRGGAVADTAAPPRREAEGGVDPVGQLALQPSSPRAAGRESGPPCSGHASRTAVTPTGVSGDRRTRAPQAERRREAIDVEGKLLQTW